MHKTAEVLVRENQTKRTVRITGNDKPEIEPEIIKRWQRIINLIAKILEVPAGLIMQAKEDSISVLLKSQNPENPYSEGGSDQLCHGLYCETVIGDNRELLIDNALTHEDWKDNPDVKLNMISYCGLPIQWEDGEFFGTICVLDNKTNYYCDNYRALLEEFKITIESDLRSAQYKQQLRYYAEMDVMTATYNRNKMESVLASEFERSRRYGEVFSLTLMDINSLKKINDTFGHCKGDEIIKTPLCQNRSRV